MKTPRYTDSAKYPNGYRKSSNSDIRATFRRIRAENQRNAEEANAKVAPLKRASK
jgi:hypothetical protein